MIALCGLAVSLMLFTLKHEHVRWSDVSPLSLFASQTGEYAIVLLFYHRKDDFDLGGSEGFVFVAIWAASIPFYFLAVRFETSTRAYSRVNGSEFDPPWLIKLWLIIGLLSGFTAFPQFAFFVKFSYWLPQIWFTALANHRRSVSLIYACGMTGGQLLFAGAIVKYHPMFEGMFVWIIGPVVVWSGLQLVVIMLQNLCGGAFFIPKRARQVRFDWRGERPAPGTECPVCLDVIEETQAFLATPCGHVFHDGWLRRWMDDHADCPFCRTVLPSIDVDSGEP
jgi:hypothetical protein